MPAVQRCSIYGCRSNSRDHNGVRFFTFPTRGTSLYQQWHFELKSDPPKLLPKGMVPTLFLKATPEFIEEERARLQELANRTRMKQLLDDVTLEWIKRAKHYPDKAKTCGSWNEIYQVANRTRDLLGATLYLVAEVHWLRNFRNSNLAQIKTIDPAAANKSLDLKDIIRDLAPDVKIFTEPQIAVLLKKHKEQQVERQKRREDVANLKGVDPKRSRHSDSFVGANGNSSANSVSSDSNEVPPQAFNVQAGMNLQMVTNMNGGYPGATYIIEGNFREAEQITKEELIIDPHQQYSLPLQITSVHSAGSLNNNLSPASTSDSVRVKPVCKIIDTIELIDDDSGAEDDLGSNSVEASQPAADEVIIDSYDQCLEHLKPIEDFALRQENYRLINALTTLERLLKDPQKD